MHLAISTTDTLTDLKTDLVVANNNNVWCCGVSFKLKYLFKMVAENVQLTSNLNSNNSQTNYLYMEIFHEDDCNEAFSGFEESDFGK